MRWCPSICLAQYSQVQVRYLGLRNNIHRFRVSSLSRPGLTHLVQVQLSDKFNKLLSPSPEFLLYNGIAKVHSTDEFFLYGGCAYNHTKLGCALFSEFRPPHSPDHDFLTCHTELAVLDLLSRLGPGVLRSNFSKVLSWNGSNYV